MISWSAKALAEHHSLQASRAVWYVDRSGGNNSVVECDLAKVEVAGSNPVSRSTLRSGMHAKGAHHSSRVDRCERRWAVRRNSRASGGRPPFALECTRRVPTVARRVVNSASESGRPFSQTTRAFIGPRAIFRGAVAKR